MEMKLYPASLDVLQLQSDLFLALCERVTPPAADPKVMGSLRAACERTLKRACDRYGIDPQEFTKLTDELDKAAHVHFALRTSNKKPSGE